MVCLHLAALKWEHSRLLETNNRLCMSKTSADLMLTASCSTSRRAQVGNENLTFLYRQLSKFIWTFTFAEETFPPFHIIADRNCSGTFVRAHHLHSNLSASHSGMLFSKSITLNCGWTADLFSNFVNGNVFLQTIQLEPY